MTDVAKSRVLYVSPGYETIWGRTCQSLYETAAEWIDAIHADDRERVRRAALTQQADGDYDIQYRVVRPNGEVRWVHDRAFPVRDASGQVLRVVGVAEDITERRSLELQVRQTQKMESVGQLAAGIAHDFNNLLTVIVSSADLLREGPTVVPSAGELIDDILEAARRGASLTRQLLAFTRQEMVEPRVVDLPLLVSDSEKLLRRLLGEHVRLVFTHAPAVPAVHVDPGQWSQVLLNLAVNARDAMPDGGVLEISTHREVVDEDIARAHPGLKPGVWAALVVRDTGAGMAPEVRARIFEPFFTTKGRGKGTGLGLSVVYGVVQQSRGHIEVDSAPGKGTTFTLRLPAASPVVAAKEVSLLPPAWGNERLMVVEDEESLRRVVSRVLSARGYLVTTAADGDEALRLCETLPAPPELLITDVVMPNVDGATLAARMRARYPSLKVLYTSGYVDESVTRRGLLERGASFLQKPYTPAVLLVRVRELLDDEPAVRLVKTHR